MHFESTISFGNILVALLTIGAIILATRGLMFRLYQMEFKLDLIWKWYQKENLDKKHEGTNK